MGVSAMQPKWVLRQAGCADGEESFPTRSLRRKLYAWRWRGFPPRHHSQQPPYSAPGKGKVDK